MKKLKLASFALLMVVMLLAILPVSVYADNTETNLTYTLSDTEVEVGDTFTLKIGNKDMNVSSIFFGVYFDNNVLEVTKRTSKPKLEYEYYDEDENDWFTDDVTPTVLSEVEEANEAGMVSLGWLLADEQNYVEKSGVITITFKAIASGTVNFVFFEDSAGPDGYIGDNVIAGVSVTVAPAAPACDHSTTKLVPNNKTHNVVCAAEGCGHVVTENVTCTGTDDGDCTTAVTCACGNVVTAASGGHVAGEDDGSCTTAVKCVNCDQDAVAAKEHSFTNKPSSTQAAPADCTNAATYYVQCDNCNAVSNNVTVSVGEAKGHCHTLGFRYVSDGAGTNTHTKYCNDCNTAIEGEKNVACADKTGDGNHACDADCGNTSVNGHTGGTAYCTQKAVCTECNTAYGEYDPTKHRATEYYPSEWKYNGDGTHSKTYTCGSCRQISSTDTEDCYDGADHGHDCDKCPSSTPRSECHGGKATCLAPALCSECSTYYGDKNPSNHASNEVTYKNVTATAHDEYHMCCDTLKEENVTHTYKADHTCECGAVEKYWFKVDYNGGVVVSSGNTTLGFGVQTDYNKTPNINGHSINPTREGYTLIGWNTKADGTGEVLNDFATFVMPDHDVTLYAQWECTHDSNYHDLTITYTDNEGEKHTKVVTCDCDTIVSTEIVEHNFNNAEHTCVCGAKFTGWEGKTYFVEAVMQTGWTKIDDAWYYFDTETGIRAEGTTRVPYPAQSTGILSDLAYARLEEDRAYAASHPNKSPFIDATEAWFVFDDDGKLVQETKIKDDKYIENGMIPWHPGFVEVGGVWYYFVGDAVNGGNMYAQGQIYVTRNCVAAGYVFSDQVVFVNGQVKTALTGVVDGYYYVNGKLMAGAGLIRIDEDYYYVRSSGKVATGKYYITKDNGIKLGTTKLYFDENGKMLPIKNGIVDGYYYVNNHIQYGVGLVQIGNDTYYIRSNGKVAIGKYYVTNVSNYTGDLKVESGDKLFFDENGKMYTPVVKNGIVEENDALYYYVNGKIAYAAGLIKIEEGVYIYVRSNGQLAVGEYYMTNLNGESGFVTNKPYTFDENGMMTK